MSRCPNCSAELSAMLDGDRSGVLVRLVSARAVERHLDSPLFNARFDIRVQSVYTITLGFAAVGFALMLQILFRRQHGPYGAHLVFALHYVSFMYLVTVAAGLSRRAGASVDVAVLCGYALIVPYLFAALGRVYAEPRRALAWKGAVLVLLTIVLNNLASFVAIRLTLALV